MRQKCVFQDVILFFQVCVLIYSTFKLMLNRSFSGICFSSLFKRDISVRVEMLFGPVPWFKPVVTLQNIEIIEETLNSTLKNEEQDISFCLSQPFCVFICFVTIVSFHFFFFDNTALHFCDGRERTRLISMVIWHAITIIVCKLNIII